MCRYVGFRLLQYPRRLADTAEEIMDLVALLGASPSHIKRTANSVADSLAN